MHISEGEIPCFTGVREKQSIQLEDISVSNLHSIIPLYYFIVSLSFMVSRNIHYSH